MECWSILLSLDLELRKSKSVEKKNYTCCEIVSFVATATVAVIGSPIDQTAVCHVEMTDCGIAGETYETKTIVQFSKQACGSGSAFIFSPGSGSESRRGKFEGKNRKNARKMEENCNFIIKY